MRFMKNSSRFDVKMARNFTRSSKGVRSSRASASTRWLKSSQLRSRSIHTSANSWGKRTFSAPWSPIDAQIAVLIIALRREEVSFAAQGRGEEGACPRSAHALETGELQQKRESRLGVLIRLVDVEPVSFVGNRHMGGRRRFVRLGREHAKEAVQQW